MWLRTASLEDLETISAMLSETWHNTYDDIYGHEKVAELTGTWHSVPALKQRLTKPRSEFIVCDDGSEIAGMAFVSQVDSETSMLHQLYVRPSTQGQGVGKMLLVEVEACFPDVRKIKLEVEEANDRAVRFYEENGFKRTGMTPDCGVKGSGIPAVKMEKVIW
ncbi:GNAT family N-acetyltransferase [Oricola cellulosilytica]|uniref:GNAT family N-acetyltransferase n=1 Tax=Oricola cellulosilytica TaxID=1429082 RepID=A0A4R0PDJ7_9HYPH|nr:GNAT family N-acetyltransferase [Oricola cellulosilytica]TCD14498.1 GNAT family N-acetyltransferase [Oricola cellulosilytica]